MDFPKQLMSITEMRKLGYSRDMLRNMVRAQGCPVVTTKNGGKYLFDTTKFEKWHIEYSKRLKK